ncbi:cell division inhibitor SulA [Rouxiella silvae]|uniref:Cell division inhibitor SulA n=1 Tax=Rouxiella silvae TaxID=1646373 RepID=A0AA40WZA9_9GAMM|nr:SOS-induced cell division inhibitor SulA [Rouxiella silvae]KQN47838.1 cell division protein [Serratia sp. Leaf50]MBF6635710.1 cell division inhibitor SulA [Rouxiella silvae]ORJ23171.1 cell division inhibitor SulA [Rouxiella silvae]
MRTHHRHHAQFSQPHITSRPTPACQNSSANSGLLSEFVYSENQPALTQLLLPLLHHLGAQSRWLLWLTPTQKLSRRWLAQSGLPVDKIVQVNQLQGIASVDAMERALLTGNYSVVLGWLPELSDSDRKRLQVAAEIGGSYGFIMKPLEERFSTGGQPPAVKIHSSVYH